MDRMCVIFKRLFRRGLLKTGRNREHVEESDKGTDQDY